MTATDGPQTLSFLEARILGVLIEKERTTPDSYPLTLNSLSAGCNQKTAREPVISASRVKAAPMGAAARSDTSASGWRQTSVPSADILMTE